MTPRYDVEHRPGGLVAVMRTGPKGGTRLIAVYRNEASAAFVCDALNQERGAEA